MQRMIKALWELKEEDRHNFGSKAVNLGIMMRAGIQVPDGYCMSQELYHKVMQPDGTIQIPDAVVHELRDVYEALHGEPLAIRSSSSLEDAEDSSFAGLYETFLNVTTFEDMIDRIKACMQSVSGERVKTYYEAKTDQKKKNSMAVIIQKMVHSQVSGVLFMANPLNNRYDQILINGAWGLGEAIVNGQVSPDQWTVDSVTSCIISERIMEKAYRTQAEEKGVSLQPVGKAMLLKACLDQDQVKQLVAIAMMVQKLYKKPQDIEWAYDGQDFFIVQSRDITTLYPIEEDVLRSKKLRLFICYNTVIQGITQPFTPLGYEFTRVNLAGWTSVYYGFKKKDLYPSWINMIHGRLYYDLTEMVGKKFYAKNIPKIFEAKDPAAAQLLRQMIKKYGPLFYKQGGAFKLSRGLIKWMIGLSKHAKLGKDTDKALKDALQMGNDFVESVASRIQQTKTIQDKIHLMEDVAEECLTVAFKQAAYCQYGMQAVEKHNKWIKKHYNNQFDLESIRQVLPNNPTTTMGIELSHIAQRLLEEGKEVTENHPLIAHFLKEYGHRGDTEMDIGTKRWKDEPRYILNLIASYMDGDSAAKSIDAMNKNNQKALDTIEAIYHQVLKDKSKRKAKRMQYDYMNYRTLAGLRERPKFDVIRVMDLLRDMMLDVGRTLQKANALEHYEDVAFLTFNDLLQADHKNLKAVVKKAKEQYHIQCQAQQIPRCIMSTGECFYHPKVEEEGLVPSDGQPVINKDYLKGTPISNGIYKGRVRVLHTPVDVDLEKGDILVTHNTNPSWTPLFLVAGALIMESGGPISHGAIVAREYGTPAVAGVTHATQLLKDGDWVIVNGEAGTVKLCEPSVKK